MCSGVPRQRNYRASAGTPKLVSGHTFCEHPQSSGGNHSQTGANGPPQRQTQRFT